MRDMAKTLGKLDVTEKKIGDALVEAVRHLYPDLDLVSDLLEGFWGLRASQEAKEKALFLTAGMGNEPRLIDMLIASGAAVDARNERGETPLMVASRGNNIAQVLTLLVKGADPNARDTRGISCLGWAALNDCQQATAFLLKAGAKDTVRDTYNELAADKARLRGHTEIAAMLKAAEPPPAPAPAETPKPPKQKKHHRRHHRH